jgi:MoaA/NifB/PqqE/SkfB family radical SAM enzyme
VELVKAEFLWTRVCPYKCSYCSMADGRKNIPTIEQWKLGIDSLKKLDCGFIAFYGAEPLADFRKLPEVVGYSERQGIHTTVISSGGVADFFGKLRALKKEGAMSLSMSYDVIGLDKSSKSKTTKALDGLRYFRELGTCRDIAAIATLTKKNLSYFSKAIQELTNEDIWFFFDFIHLDRGQPGSKCKSFPGQEELVFGSEDIPELKKVLMQILDLKNKGYLCHTSRQFIELVSSRSALTYDWHCGKSEVFPSWVSVDCDGEVGICDDYRPTVPKDKKIYIWELFDKWSEFKSYWKEHVMPCPGCLWNTHVDAHLIKEGKLPFSDYVHTEN